jgi:hypothetical protein
MSKKDIKKQNKDLNIHLVDIIAKFDPSETGKYTNFLVNILNEKLEDEKKNVWSKVKNSLRERRLRRNSLLQEFEPPKGDNSIETTFIHYLTDVYGHENIETLFLFNEHLKNNRISEGKRDISNYANFEDLSKEVSLATIKYSRKKLEKEVLIVHESEEWLIIRPLTVESSLTYGASTKWCTASRNNRDYFYRYSKNGVLCYAINKMNGDKYGLFYDIETSDFSIWNVIDKRIDSIEANIPRDIMTSIFIYMKNEKCNFDYFSEEEKEKSFDFEPKLAEIPVQDMALMPIEENTYGVDGENFMYLEEDVTEEPYLEERGLGGDPA